MSEVAGNSPRKFISFRHLGFESSAHNLPEEWEFEKPRKIAQIDDVNTVVVGETLESPAKVTSFLQVAPMRIESIGMKRGMETVI